MFLVMLVCFLSLLPLLILKIYPIIIENIAAVKNEYIIWLRFIYDNEITIIKASNKKQLIETGILNIWDIIKATASSPPQAPSLYITIPQPTPTKTPPIIDASNNWFDKSKKIDGVLSNIK